MRLPSVIPGVSKQQTENKKVAAIANSAVKAAMLEASVEKPGNVTPTKSFPDLTYDDMLTAARALRNPMYEAAKRGSLLSSGELEPADIGLGELVYKAVREAREVTEGEVNANFGIVLLFVPIAASAGCSYSLKDNIEVMLSTATYEDTINIYKAIREARPNIRNPDVGELDVWKEGVLKKIEREQLTPLDVFEKARKTDNIAREWLTAYSLTFEYVEKLDKNLSKGQDMDDAILITYLELLADWPDTLISRKNNVETAMQVAKKSASLLKLGFESREFKEGLSKFDDYLRSDGNKLNPGTTADIIASALFVWDLTQH